ncbi:MAG: ABC transporter ATP-binding protein [Bdellovibrionota bacterium]|nr:ABC transporter ATP-binding protein [Bdellovibrionota bacterium]
MTKALDLRNVHLSFGEKSVLKDLNLEIEQGSCHSLLGPNGAGKTSSISIVLDLMQADSGEVKIFNKDSHSVEAKFLRASTPQDTDFVDNIKVGEILNFIKKLYKSDVDVGEISERFQLEKLLKSSAQKMSGGQKRLLSIASAFISNAQLLLLDEPTSGLDLDAKEVVWNEIRKFTRAGGSVLLTTHHMEEAEALSDTVSFLHQGKRIAHGQLEDLKNNYHHKNIYFSCETSLPANFQKISPEEDSSAACGLLKHELLDQLVSSDYNPKTKRHHFQYVTAEPEDFIKLLFKEEVRFRDLVVKEASLEEMFHKIQDGSF